MDNQSGRDPDLLEWRYQPVFNANGDITLCEVYLDYNGKLEMWTEESKIAPSGDTIAELLKDLEHMSADAQRWKPVLFNSLHVGMDFEPVAEPS